jgi:hypothetical protein
MKKIFIYLGFLLLLIGCQKPLDEEVFTTLGPSNFYKTAADAESLLTSVYAVSQGYRDIGRDYLAVGEMTTDIMIERQGAINTLTQPFEDFTWDATHAWLSGFWGRYYNAIYRANVVIDKVPAIDMNEDRKAQIIAEARFIRAFNYFYLYDLFGPTPLIVSSETSATDKPARATKEEFVKFVEDEFLAVSKILPATQSDYPRATKGAALGFLTKFYLNNKQWAEAAETAKEIIDSHTYSLFKGADRTELFDIKNERNNEFIYVVPFIPLSSIGNTYISHAAPPGYVFKYPPHVNFAAQFKVRSDFVNTFDPQDQRRNAFLFEYVNNAGKTIVLGQDDVRSFKYPEDPNGLGDVTGNDFPLLRYADILLSRAEALNELNGPNQESLDLINQVRDAAGLPGLVLTDFPDKTSLRDHILLERGWEFHTEALRRQDLIRMGKFISWAQQRGKPAKDYMVLFPIPQREIDANPNLEQNPGY